MSSVYFAKRRADGLIKIGASYNPEGRLRALGRRGDMLELLATYPGCQKVEGRFHALLAEHHAGHEWFRPHDQVFAVIAAIVRGTFDAATLPNVASPMRSEIARLAWAKRRTLHRPDHRDESLTLHRRGPAETEPQHTERNQEAA